MRPFVLPALAMSSLLIWYAAGLSFVMNLSPSLPRGLYLVEPPTDVHYGTLLLFTPPTPIATLAALRGYLPPNVPFLKPAGALAGDTVCVTETTVSVNGATVAPVWRTDTLNQVLPVWHQCVTVAPDEIFPLSTYDEHSLDGRYFGPIPLKNLRGIATPLLTWR